MNHDSDNRMSDGFGTETRGRAGSQRYTLFMEFYTTNDLHIFVAEPVNPVHIFHDAYTLPFYLTADHI